MLAKRSPSVDFAMQGMLNKIIGNYQILEKIGEGGMGEVFRGVDMMLEREVAIKFLRPELARQPEIIERFRTEAKALGGLSHSNIATLYSFIREDDEFFMVMEFAHGQTLEQIIRGYSGGMPLEWACTLFCQALQAIAHAHEKGIIHRDIKPANMMLSGEGVLKVLDFGIARLLGSVHLTRTGLAVGTLKYMSPEQVQGRGIGPPSDIYSLGIVLYEMLSGRPPFGGSSEYELMRAQIEQSPPPLQALVPSLPAPIGDAVICALAKAPEERFQTALEFLEALRYALPPSTFSSEKKVTSISPKPPSPPSARAQPQSSDVNSSSDPSAEAAAGTLPEIVKNDQKTPDKRFLT